MIPNPRKNKSSSVEKTPKGRKEVKHDKENINVRLIVRSKSAYMKEKSSMGRSRRLRKVVLVCVQYVVGKNKVKV